MRGAGSYRDGGMTFSYQLTPWVKRLLIANTVVFALTYLIGQGFVFEWFSFQPTKILFRPWTPFTYMFLHLDFWHLFMNMLGLFFFGPQLESKWGSSEFIRYYLVCGFGGAALSLLFLLFEFEDVALRFTDGALDAIAEQAVERKIGARGLRMIMEELMLDMMFTLPSEKNAREVVVSRDVVVNKSNPLVVMEKTG